MKIFYRPETGKLIDRVKEIDISNYDTSRLALGYGIYIVDEIQENAALVQDLIGYAVQLGNTATEQNVGKYYISGGELYMREGWEVIHDEY